MPDFVTANAVTARVPRFPRSVDDVTVRVIAAEVLVITVVALVARQPWLYAVLAVDFALRAGFGPQASPLARLAKVMRRRLAAPPRPTAGPPKRFAAAIGAVMTGLATVFFYGLGWHLAAWVVGAIMIVFPALEAVFGLCVGCRAFAILMRVGLVPEEVCLDCADISRRQRTA